MPDTPPPPAFPPEDGWDRYLAYYHGAHPGITEDVLADARDHDGRTPYDWLVEALPADASTVVDLACGSGPVARALARGPSVGGGSVGGRLVGGPSVGGRSVGARVVGVDLSAGELARARSARPSALLVRARATALPIADATADAVVVSMALMLLNPVEAVLAEARRLLRPGGTFAATVPTRATATDADETAGVSAFAEILAALGQAATDYPEPLARGTLSDRFAASGLRLLGDEAGLFARTVRGPGDAGLVVRSFYAPGADEDRVAAAVAGFERRVGSEPLRVGYRLRRLVAVR